MSQHFAGRKAAVIAGDRRQHEIVRQLRSEGASVRTFGVPRWRAPDGVTDHATFAEAVAGADLVVLPVPTFLRPGFLYAPESEAELPFGAAEIGVVDKGTVLAISRIPPDLDSALRARQITACVMADDDIMQVHHAIPTAEGALRITIENTDFTVFGSTAVVVGFGRVAQSMARALKGLGARVIVIARREEARVRAHAEGFGAADLAELPGIVASADLVYNTVPVDIVDRQVLERVRPGALVIDLASPPGGVDQAAAAELGVRSIWARGQAGSAPREAGRAQFDVIARFVAQSVTAVGAARADD